MSGLGIQLVSKSQNSLDRLVQQFTALRWFGYDGTATQSCTVGKKQLLSFRAYVSFATTALKVVR